MTGLKYDFDIENEKYREVNARFLSEWQKAAERGELRPSNQREFLRSMLIRYLDSLSAEEEIKVVSACMTNRVHAIAPFRINVILWRGNAKLLEGLESYLLKNSFIKEKSFAPCFSVVRIENRIPIGNFIRPRGWKRCDFNEATTLMKLFDELVSKKYVETSFERKGRYRYGHLIENFTVKGRTLSEESMDKLRLKSTKDKERTRLLLEFVRNMP